MFPLVRDHARGRRRNPGIASRAPRFHAHIQNFLAPPLHRLFTPILAFLRSYASNRGERLERELHLQIDPAVRRGSIRIGLRRKRICLAKQRRTQITNRRSIIDIVKDVPRADTEGQVIARIRWRAAAKHARAAAWTAATRHSATTTAASASCSSAPLPAGCGFLLLPKTKCLAESQVH